MRLSFVGFDFMCWALFIICSWHALRIVRSRQRFLELVMALVFGVLLEELNVVMSRGFYVYGRDFLIIFDEAPLSIGMGWAVIIYSAMQISDSYGLSEYAKPFFDAIQAILIDLSMDAVAIRLGFWRWPIPLTAGWFGVPAGNFFGWILVVALYSGYTRFIRHLMKEKEDERYIFLQLASPPICYEILFSIGMLAYTLFVTEVQRFIALASELLIFCAVVISSVARHGLRPRGRVEPTMSFVQLSFHVVFLVALIITGIYVQIPAMIPIAIILLGMELALHMTPAYMLRRQQRNRHLPGAS